VLTRCHPLTVLCRSDALPLYRSLTAYMLR
jgi:hypothetical protein